MTCYSILTDIYILVLPIPLIIKLHMRKWKKLLVGVTFAVGYVVLILAVSLHALFQLARRGWQFGPYALLSSRDYSSLPSNRTTICETRNESLFRLSHLQATYKPQAAQVQQSEVAVEIIQHQQSHSREYDQVLEVPRTTCTTKDLRQSPD
ncbi:MAG: hypothetical protein Q9162_003957 [Coniocarpon cinnabarinum]